jgi:hypothetical protein
LRLRKLAVGANTCRLRDRDEGHGHSDGYDAYRHVETKRIVTANGLVRLDAFEDGAPPRFRPPGKAWLLGVVDIVHALTSDKSG